MRIEEYLSKLCASLKVDPLRRDEIRLEMHLHLRERADAYRRQGLDAEEAERRATAEFGDPADLAAQLSLPRPASSFLHIARHVDRVGALFIGYGIVNLLAMIMLIVLFQSRVLGMNLQPDWIMPLILVIVLVLAALQMFFGMALLHHRRWARVPVMVLSVLTLGNIPGAALGIYALWTLLHPQSRQVCYA